MPTLERHSPGKYLTPWYETFSKMKIPHFQMEHDTTCLKYIG